MWTNSKSIRLTIVFVALASTEVQFEPGVFGQAVNVSRQGTTPNVQFDARQAVAHAVGQSQTAPVAVYHAFPPADQPAVQSKGKYKKWIWIVVAAAGAGVAVAIIAHDNKPSPPVESPSIVVGAPSVGQPQ